MVLIAPLLALGLLVAARDWPRRWPWLLSASLGLPTSAAVAVGGQVLSPFFVVGLIAIAVTTFSWLRGKPFAHSWPGSLLLLGFVVWSLFITLAGPTFFDGVDVLATEGGIDAQVRDPSPLTYSLSNVAQAAYLVVNTLIIATLVNAHRLSPHLLAPALGIMMFASNWRLAHDKLGVPYPTSAIDSGGFRYIDSTAQGVYRLRGVFPEPAGLGIVAVAACTFAAFMAFKTHGAVRSFYVAVLASGGLNLIYADSGTGTLGIIVVAAVAAVFVLRKTARDATTTFQLAIGSGIAVLAVLLFLRPQISGVAQAIIDKLDSQSYTSRSGADSFSYQLGVEVFGVGTGLGSNRPSSLWPMLFSCVGVLGVVLFASMLGVLLWRSASNPAWRATRWTLLAVILCKSIAGSALSDPLLTMCLALVAYAGLTAATATDPPSAVGHEVPTGDNRVTAGRV